MNLTDTYSKDVKSLETLSERHIFQCHLGTPWETLSARHIIIFLLLEFIPELKRSIPGDKSEINLNNAYNNN